MNSLPPLPSLRDVIERHGLMARKSLGQHFLLDGNITRKIALLQGSLEGLHILEVGPGPGGLTRALLIAGAECVTAVEKDPRCLPALTELAAVSGGRLQVLEQDALGFQALDTLPAPRAVIANLPYNVGTLLLLRWLEDVARAGPESYRFLTLMFQKEVADRLTAAPNSKAYGRLSVMAQFLCDVRHGFDLPASAFTPPPKVDSTVLVLTPLSRPRFMVEPKQLEKITACAFNQRRKMLRVALKPLRADAEARLEAAGIDPTRRAETLSIEEFCRLANHF